MGYNRMKGSTFQASNPLSPSFPDTQRPTIWQLSLTPTLGHTAGWFVDGMVVESVFTMMGNGKAWCDKRTRAPSPIVLYCILRIGPTLAWYDIE